MLKIAFAGTPQFAVPTLQALAASSHRLVGVLTQPDRPAGRGRALTASPVKVLAMQLGLPLSQPASLRSESERAELARWQPDVLVVAAYGLILPLAALALPSRGCINVHASLLPRWRGAAPVQRAILAGDRVSGVTIMQMAAGLDTGPILAQQSLELSGREGAQMLLARLAEAGAHALIDTLNALEAGTVTPVEQSPEGVTYAAKLDKREAQVDWRRSAAEIDRQIRALDAWPVAQTLFQGQPLRLWEAAPIDTEPSAGPPGAILDWGSGAIVVGCGQGRLAITRLQPAGKRAMSAGEFAAGRSLDGMRFG